MAFESLSDKITGVFKRLKSKGKLTESDAMVIEGFEDYGVVSDWAKVYVNAIYSNKIMVGISEYT